MRKLLLVPVAYLLTVFAPSDLMADSPKAQPPASCPDYSGLWDGSCPGTDVLGEDGKIELGTLTERLLEIKQEKCEKISWRATNYSDTLAEARDTLAKEKFQEIKLGEKAKYPGFLVSPDFKVNDGSLVTVDWIENNQKVRVVQNWVAQSKAEVTDPANANLRQTFESKETWSFKEKERLTTAHDTTVQTEMRQGKQWELVDRSKSHSDCTYRRIK
jgi:hypothetical protein